MGKKLPMFEENYALFMEKFPQIALQIPSTEKGEEEKELLEIHLKEAEVFYFYGIGQGEAYAQASDWLKKNPSRRLIFLEDDLEKYSLFLHSRDAGKILEDGQVVLALTSDLEQVAAKFPALQVEIGSLPSKRRRFKKFREELLKK